MNHVTPRNSITIKGTLPKRWEFLSIQLGYKKAWNKLLVRIDTVAEHASALMGANGITAINAVNQAIDDLIKVERLEYTNGYYWNLTPTHRKAIVAWLQTP